MTVKPLMAGWTSVAAESPHTPVHVPVLVDEVLAYLVPRPGAVIVDATVGEGGHAEAILRRIAPAGRLIAVDRDADAIRRAEERLRPFGRNVMLYQANFEDLDQVLDEAGVGAVDGMLLDIGISTLQLFEPARGFSFDRVGPLDMRMDQRQDTTAADLVNTLPERDLADLIYRYGEERASRRIAREIVARRPLRTTRDLARAVEAAVRGARGRLHPATRTFQALRIATNRETEALERGLPQAIHRLRPGGRICVIAFHSLEDRIVKQTLARYSRGCTCAPAAQDARPIGPPGERPAVLPDADQGQKPAPGVLPDARLARLPECRCGGRVLRLLTKKPVTPSPEEIRRNPRARSARLRAAERLSAPEAPRTRRRTRESEDR